MAGEEEKIRVLLAEDHTLMREMTRRLLEQSGMEVVAEAGDGAEAVARALQHCPDIVLMDIAMPNVNGVEATRQIKEQCAQTAVVILTAYDDDPYVFALAEAGAAGYLMKSVTSSELVEAIHRVRAGESILHPRVAKKLLDYFSARHQPAGVTSPSDSLSERERDILILAAKGKGNKEIAAHFQVSERTVQAHLSHIFNKLGVASRTEAVIRALQRGWLRMEKLNEE